jgi:hypothetical protein
MKGIIVRKLANIFSILLIGACCVIAGCSSLSSSGSQPNETQHGVNIGFSPGNQTIYTGEYKSDMATNSLYTIIFPYDTTHEVFDELQQTNITPATRSQDIHILYVNGNNLDESGKANRWTYAIRHLNRTSLVTFDNHGMTITEWTASMPKDEIFFDQIMLPPELFNKNREVIFTTADAGVTEQRDLALGKGIYTLTITNQVKPRILTFDAKTGALS